MNLKVGDKVIVIAGSNKGKEGEILKVLDEKEYAHHRATYKYGDDLDTVLKYTTSLIIEKMKKKEFPFDDQKIQEYFQEFLEMTKKKEEKAL